MPNPMPNKMDNTERDALMIAEYNRLMEKCEAQDDKGREKYYEYIRGVFKKQFDLSSNRIDQILKLEILKQNYEQALEEIHRLKALLMANNIGD
jgi:protein-disulfide isomerase